MAMDGVAVCFVNEAAMAAWWRTGAITGRHLRTLDGRAVQVLYPGRPGGSAGPDFRDAVVLLDGARHTGDIELHLRSSGWHAHGHDRDPAYNAVVLHIVAGGALPTVATQLASGALTPIVVVPDLVQLDDAPQESLLWPCQVAPLVDERMISFLHWAGVQRFAHRVARFHVELAATPDLDAVLLTAIAEAFGYGRSSIATRALGTRMLAGQPYRDDHLDALSTRRLRGFAQLPAWEAATPGVLCCGALLAGGSADGWQRLIALFVPATPSARRQTALSASRAAIVVWNAVLPCLAAYGDRCGNRALSRLARAVAASAPGLPSNTITRSMASWLQLHHAPAGALAQQGLHHVHAQWCKAKHCEACPLSVTPHSV